MGRWAAAGGVSWQVVVAEKEVPGPGAPVKPLGQGWGTEACSRPEEEGQQLWRETGKKAPKSVSMRSENSQLQWGGRTGHRGAAGREVSVCEPKCPFCPCGCEGEKSGRTHRAGLSKPLLLFPPVGALGWVPGSRNTKAFKNAGRGCGSPGAARGWGGG